MWFVVPWFYYRFYDCVGCLFLFICFSVLFCLFGGCCIASYYCLLGLHFGVVLLFCLPLCWGLLIPLFA